MYADVAVCLPLTRTFAYRLNEPVQIGCRVLVPFRKREVEGFVVGLRGEPPADIEVHSIGSIIDRTPLVRPEIFELCRWISEYYVSPPGEVLKSALPPGISAKHVERGLKPATTFENKTSGDKRDSENVVAGFSPRPFLTAGKTSLILVPEIGLTPQLTRRFAERFPGRTAVLHSSLTRRQRIDEWLRIYNGAVPIVIGTRSAVFAPLQNLGLIVVDEEHETSYKQEEVPRYSARDTAVMRGKLAEAAVVLGSATPSMESFRNAESKKYEYVALTTRVEDRPLPGVEIVNMRDEYAAEGRQVVFSRRLLQAVAERLERREQTMILLNRRGYAAFLLCRHCGFNFQCNSCSVAMPYHRAIDKLLCHYCGFARRPPKRCSECDSEYIHYE